MSSSPREAAAADAARIQSKYSAQLADVTFPALDKLFGMIGKDLDPSGISPSVGAAYDKVREGTERDFGRVGRGQAAYLQQAYKQSGMPYSQDQVDESMANAARALDQQKSQAMRQIQFSEANAGLSQYNNLINLLGAGAGAELNLARGFSSIQNAAIGGLSGTSQGQGALAGAAAGASAGAVGGPWGAVIGGVLGGVGGYFGAG